MEIDYIIREKEYWEERFKLLEQAKQNKTDLYTDQIKRQFTRAIKKCEERIAYFYQRYADEQGIPYEEAQRILTPPEKEELKMNIQEYIQKGEMNALDYNAVTADELEKASIAYRTTRLQATELELKAIAASLYTKVAQDAYTALYEVYNDVYHMAAFEVFKGTGVVDTTFSGLNPNQIADILRTPWRDGVTFSERIWLDQQKLMQNLADELSSGVLNGDSYQDMARRLRDKMDSSYYNAYRIVNTESAYFYGEAQKNSAKELNVKKYRFRAQLSTRVCSHCADLDSKVFSYDERQAGVNAVPMHPNCRCIEIFFLEADDLSQRTRSGRNLEGKSVRFPADMTYQDWYKEVGEKLEEEEKQKKKRKKKTADPKKPTIRIAQ